MKYGALESPEPDPTILLKEGKNDVDSQLSWWKGAAVLLACALAAISAASYVPQSSGVSLASQASQSTPNLIMDNEHTRRTGRPIGDGKYNLQNIAQVMKETRLQLDTSEFAKWTVDGELVSDEPSDEIYYTFTTVGKHTVVAEYMAGSVTFDIHVKIVRYEIRDLIPDERDSYFRALRIFYTIGQREGVEVYGSQFKSSDYLVRLHLQGAADLACDHWHDDAGIMNHHVGITWMFEKSMRMIDPKTAAHYWDYTRDAVTNDLGTNIWFEAPVFKENWFGSNSPDNSNHAIDTGRFAYTQVLQNARTFSNITNPYGLMRSPWNTNPTPYVMRFNRTLGIFADDWSTFPTCEDFQEAVGLSFARLSNELNGLLHGPVHVMIGGQWDYTDRWSLVMHSVSYPDNFLLLSKFLWRQGFVRTPEVCSVDTPHSECMPYCPKETMGNATAEELMQKAGVNAVNGDVGFQKAMDAVGFTNEDLLDMICHVGSAGEMFTSAAPQDPIFWPLHGNAERFLQYVRLMKEEGLITFDETWGYEHMTNLASDTGMVCEWEGVSGMELPTCVRATCPGHKEDDLLPFRDLLDSQHSLYSNKDFYGLIHPDNEGLPYAYDSLSYWEACRNQTISP